MILPQKLSQGDCVAIIAPSSSTNESELNAALKSIEAFGLKPKVYPSCYARHGHLSGSDAVRAKDVNDAFSNPLVKGILCLRGGYGTPRILADIDYNMIAHNPKVFLGYSDITALHIALNQLAKLVTFHGPMPAPAWGNGLDDYTLQHLKRALYSSGPLGTLRNPSGEALLTMVPGNVKGRLVGGNLSLLTATLGSPYEVDTKGKILFIEEVNEQFYVIDCMLTSLRLAGKFNDAAGIIFGTFSKCHKDIKSSGFEDLDLMTILNEIIVPFNKPTVFNFRAGHNYPQPTLPLGVDVVLNASEPAISFNKVHCRD